MHGETGSLGFCGGLLSGLGLFGFELPGLDLSGLEGACGLAGSGFEPFGFEPFGFELLGFELLLALAGDEAALAVPGRMSASAAMVPSSLFIYHRFFTKFTA